MKNRFIYIFTFLLFFMICSVNVNASTLEFTCGYEWVLFPATSGKGGDQDAIYYDLEVRLYDDETVKFFVDNKELENNWYLRDVKDGDFGNYIVHYNAKEFIENAKKDGNITCPAITTQLMDGTFTILFGEGYQNDSITFFAGKVKSGYPKINSSLSSDKQQELQDKVIEEILPGCDFSYNKNKLKDIDKDLNFHFFKKSDGKYYIRMNFDRSNSSEIEYTDENGAYISVGGYNFEFHKGELSSFFPTNSNQDENPFICIKNEDISITLTYNDGNIKNVLITTDKDYAKDNSYYGDVSNLNNGTTSEFYENEYNFEEKVSSVTGICTDYLGSVDDSEYNLAKLLNTVYMFIKIFSIVLLILFSLIDFAKSVAQSKDDLMKSVVKFGKRLVILLIILLLPTFIDMLGNLFGITDILCGIK